MHSMKSWFILRPLLLSTVAMLLVISTPRIGFGADEFQVGSSAVVTGTEGSGLRVRSGPGPTNNVLTTLKDGEKVEITGSPMESNGLTWYPVKSGSVSGWSTAQFLTAPKSGDSQTVTASTRSDAASELVTSDATGGPELRMVQLLNDARVARGLNPLAWNVELAKA